MNRVAVPAANFNRVIAAAAQNEVAGRRTRAADEVVAACFNGNAAGVGQSGIACGIGAEIATLDRIAGSDQSKCITRIKARVEKPIDDQTFEGVVGGVHDKGAAWRVGAVDFDAQNGVIAHSQSVGA